MKKFITAKETDHAKEILGRLASRDIMLKINLESVNDLAAKAEAARDYNDMQHWQGRLHGSLDTLKILDLINFDEQQILGRYFIVRQRETMNELRKGA